MEDAAAHTGEMNAAQREWDVLVHTVKLRFDAAAAGELRRVVEQGVDWNRLLAAALVHRVQPMLYSALTIGCPNAVPDFMLLRLRARVYANSARNLFLAHKLVEILKLFESERIAALPYKGPTMAALIYRDLSLRQIGDLDILVRDRDYAKAQGLLMRRQFRRTIEHEWECELAADDGSFAVDLHRRMTSEECSCPLTFEDLSQRLRRVSLGGTPVPALSPEDTLLMLGIQVAKDRCPQLIKFCDLGELMARRGSVNWPVALRRAQRTGGRRILLFALSLASELLSIELPGELAHALRPETLPRQLARQASANYRLGGSKSGADPLMAGGFSRLMRERLRDKLRPHFIYARGLMAPCELDRRVLALPECFAFCYYLIRPVRLAARYSVLFCKRLSFGTW